MFFRGKEKKGKSVTFKLTHTKKNPKLSCVCPQKTPTQTHYNTQNPEAKTQVVAQLKGKVTPVLYVPWLKVFLDCWCASNPLVLWFLWSRGELICKCSFYCIGFSTWALWDKPFCFFSTDRKCSVFYTAPKHSAMLSKVCHANVCQCAEGKASLKEDNYFYKPLTWELLSPERTITIILMHNTGHKASSSMFGTK